MKKRESKSKQQKIVLAFRGKDLETHRRVKALAVSEGRTMAKQAIRLLETHPEIANA